MDNLTHSLVGAALGQAGLKRRTPLALSTLVIGANLPDIDALSYWTGGRLGFRRGWTHGVLALAVLPLLLTALVLAGDHGLRRRRERHATGGPAIPREVLLLAFLSILTHPFLDWFNTYGLRWLMPFRGTWFYGDAWFIIDPWVWLVLGAGVWISAYRDARALPAAQADRPARLALAVTAVYAAFMLASGAAGRALVARDLAAAGRPPAEVMVAPVFGNPLTRDVLVREGDAYRFGTLHMVPPRLDMRGDVLPRGLGDPAAHAAAATPAGREFLAWARFPFFQVRHTPGATVVIIADARYGAQGWARTLVLLPPP